MNLSKNFTLAEFVTSQAAARLGIDNTPNGEQIENLKILAGKLEEVREALGAPVVITSGFRNETVNRIVRGARNSMHMFGSAADFIAPAFGTPYEICERIRTKGIVMDQVIHEYGQWVHLSFTGRSDDRREFLTICSAKQGYRRGVFRCGF